MAYKSFLSLDIGSQHTRAWLFDNEGGEYKLKGGSEAQTTIAAGMNIQEGVWDAMVHLQEVTGRRLLAHNGKPILNQDNPNMGVEQAAICISAGKPIKTALFGLTDKASLAGLRRLSNFFYTEETLLLSLQSGLNAMDMLEELVESNADLIILAGGTEQGAEKPLRSILENIRIYYHSHPRLFKPQIVFVGNTSLKEMVIKKLEAGQDLHVADNIQPIYDQFNLSVAWDAMLTAFERIRLFQINGLQELRQTFNTKIIPTSYAMGRIVRYLSKTSKGGKGVTALDVGAGSTTLAAAQNENFIGTLTHTPIGLDTGEQVSTWSSIELDVETATTYMQNKKLHPAFMPATLEDLAFEHAWTRVRLQDALDNTKLLFPDFKYTRQKGLDGIYEPIIMSGESLVNVPSLVQTCLMALDGIQPNGITTLALDKDQIMASLGSLTTVEPLMAVQLLDTAIFTNLGTVICVDSPARIGDLVLTIEVAREEGQREILEISKGQLKRIEVNRGVHIRLYLAPEKDSDVGMGKRGLGGWVSVVGAEVGVIIDARGRPLQLPKSAQSRSRLIRDWIWELGG